jgi:iron complex outermembrane receptor protein
VAACATNGITSFTFGTSNALLPHNISVHPTRTQYRGVIGADGKFNAFGTDWHYDAYYTHGENTTNIHVNNIMLNPRYRAAIQATLVNGQIVCADPSPGPTAASRSTSSADSGPATRRWPTSRPRTARTSTRSRSRTSPASTSAASPSTDGRDPWPGVRRRVSPRSLPRPGRPLRRRFGGSPYTADYPADPLLNTAGNNWYAGNYHSGAGKYSVKEAYAEVNVPLVNSEAAGKANLNAAGRWTDYSTSGTVYTWKVGGHLGHADRRRPPAGGDLARRARAQPVGAVRRAGHDHAAQLHHSLERHAPTGPTRGTRRAAGPPERGRQPGPETGNRQERSTLGVVLSNPKWLPGFSVSVDWYNIVLNGGISSLSAQQVVNFCYAGLTQYCGSFNFAPPAGTTAYVNAQVFNLASIKTSGFDIEASYRFDVPACRATSTCAPWRRTPTSSSPIKASPAAPLSTTAGQNSGATPDWKVLAVQTWTSDRFMLSLQERWFSDGVIGGQYIECAAGSCPVGRSAADNNNYPTIDYNQMKGATYVDLSGSYEIKDGLHGLFQGRQPVQQGPDAVAANQYRPGRQPGALRPAGPVLSRRPALQLLT